MKMYQISLYEMGTVLNNNHTYYDQMLMAAAHRQWCDFLVFSHHGYYLERVIFNKARWVQLEDAATRFSLDF